jgi:hypothetical protein
MSTMSKFAAAAAMTILIVPTRGSAQDWPHAHAEYGQERTTNALSRAHTASKSLRVTRAAQRGRVSRPPGPSLDRVLTPDGREMGADPDAAIRFQLRRDYSSGRM